MTLRSVERAAILLRLVATQGVPIGVSDAAAALGVAKSSAHELLRTLHEVGFLDQDGGPGRYRLGAGARSLAQGPPDTNLMRSLATNCVDALAARSGESAYMGVLRGADVLIVHHVFRPDDSSQRIEVGERHPAHASAMGQVLLAMDPAGQAVARTLAPESLTRRTLTGAALGARLAAVRRDQLACAVGERTPELAEIAVPLRGRGSTIVAAVALIGHTDRLTDARGRPRAALVGQVRMAASAIGADLASGL